MSDAQPKFKKWVELTQTEARRRRVYVDAVDGVEYVRGQLLKPGPMGMNERRGLARLLEHNIGILEGFQP